MVYREQRTGRLGCLQLLLIIPGVILLFAAWQYLSSTRPVPTSTALVAGTPTMPAVLHRADVLPTATLAPDAPTRQIIFPGAQMVARIVPSLRSGDTWETRNLGSSVGLLQGTSWLDDPGGNIVLAGHVEDALGHPGPFAHLLDAKPGDVVILRDGTRENAYHVTSTQRVPPDAMEYVAQDGRHRVTLITCADYDFKAQDYQTRVVVVAEPDTGQ